MPDCAFATAESVQQRAIELARRGLGWVEPNPPVGAVVVDDNRRLLGEGFHERFGGPHAEIQALRAAGDQANAATLFVTLEPCCHQGKTGPCTDAVIAAGIRRVVIGVEDPNPDVSGGGIAALRNAGVEVETGLLAAECQRLIAPFSKLITRQLPWVHAKWAMTLDGKFATRTGHSQWISNEKSRAVVHDLRGRMDAILVGAETVAIDDPLLTARPPGPRTALRLVVSRSARLPADSQLVATAAEFPTAVTTVGEVGEQLQSAGIEILSLPVRNGNVDLRELLRELGRRKMTNLLVEGGSQLLGAFHDAGLIDEYHVFIAPKLAGGKHAATPLRGIGREAINERPDLHNVRIELLDTDVYIHGDARSEP